MGEGNFKYEAKPEKFNPSAKLTFNCTLVYLYVASFEYGGRERPFTFRVHVRVHLHVHVRVPVRVQLRVRVYVRVRVRVIQIQRRVAINSKKSIKLYIELVKSY